jgi:hypothetical protein
MLPKAFPPSPNAIRRYHCRDDGTSLGVNHALVIQAREAEGDEASPTTWVTDSQSVKSTDAGKPHRCEAGGRGFVDPSVVLAMVACRRPP